MPARDLIDRFGREEDAFLQTELIAPVSAGAAVRVRIAGIVCEMTVRGAASGLVVLKPRSHRECDVVRPATKTESRRYLDLFPRARLIVVVKHGSWFGLPAAAPEKGAKVEGVVPIAFGDALGLFQTALVRFDGSLFLFESAERSPVAAYLRGELSQRTKPSDLDRKGLTREEREAYAIRLRIEEEFDKTEDDRRLAKALELAGARLVTVDEKGGSFHVGFSVDGQQYQGVIAKNLTVLSAGICLSGRDRDFDLTSLVSVLREKRRGRT